LVSGYQPLLTIKKSSDIISRVGELYLSNKRTKQKASFEDFQEEEKPRRKTYALDKVYLLDQDEVNQLINASNAPVEEKPIDYDRKYPTYTKNEVADLLNNKYIPKIKKKKEHGQL
jgi:hypothetical protein